MLEEDESDVLYLDIDARIRRRPVLFDDFSGDLGVHYKDGRELLSGTLYFRNTILVRKLVEEWVTHQVRHPTMWDQKTLQAILLKWKKAKRRIQVVDLPPAYTQIFDTMAHNGEPVIEHLQASRKYKGSVVVGRKIPRVVGKSRIREAPDGTYWIPKRDPQAEKFLDKHCARLENQLRWFPIFGALDKINEHRSVFAEKRCYIVGKGPSLDRLSAADFTDDSPIIALNEAIHKVESLDLPNPTYCLQQDGKLRDRCQPERAWLFVSVKAVRFYTDRPRVLVFDGRQYGLALNSLSVLAAMRITQSLGCTGYTLLCFDACVDGDTRYAKCIGMDSTWGGRPRRFLTHRGQIEQASRGLPLKWATPVDPAAATVGKSQQ
jgi:hypothetical protein